MKSAHPEHILDIREHMIAERLEAIVLEQLSNEKEKQGVTEDALGKIAYTHSGLSDLQKKVHNLISGKTKMRLKDFYLLCGGLGVPVERIFASSVYEAIKNVDAEIAALDSSGEALSKKVRKKTNVTELPPTIQPIENENSNRH